jgi:hypothetical protein
MTESDNSNLTRCDESQARIFLDPAIWDDFKFQQLSTAAKLYTLMFLMRPERKAWSDRLLGELIGEEFDENAELEALEELEELEGFLTTPHGEPAPADQGRAGCQ